MTIWRMRMACWITKATDTHSEYVIPIAFPLQKLVARTCLDVTSHAHCLSVAAVDNSSFTGDNQTRIVKLLSSRWSSYKTSEVRTAACGTHRIHAYINKLCI